MGQAMAHDACARQSHVDAQLSQLENTVVRLQSIFDLLTDRIGSVLYFTPDAGLNKCAPEETLAPLADRVRHSCQRLQELECRMNSEPIAERCSNTGGFSSAATSKHEGRG
jgi:hypothetical protein